MSSSRRSVRAMIFSNPVGFSGGKNRCGRSQVELSSLACALSGIGASSLVGDQSITSSSSSSSRLIRGSREGGAVARIDVDELNEGMPNTGLGFVDGGGVRTGFEESVREARRSYSLSFGILVEMGVEVWEEDVAGVLDRVLDRLLKWEWVSMSRIGGGSCTRMKRKYAKRANNSVQRARDRYRKGWFRKLGTRLMFFCCRGSDIENASRKAHAIIWQIM